MSEDKKNGSQGEEGWSPESPNESHDAKVQRFQVAKTRSRALSKYILSPPFVNTADKNTIKTANLVQECGSFLVFRHYYTIGEYRMAGNHFCAKHLFCAICALRRAAKYLRSYLEKADIVLRENPGCRLVFGTVTVKNGSDLMERFRHLHGSWAKMVKKRNNHLKGQPLQTVFADFKGVVATYEFTNKGNGWHPHIHFIALVGSDFSCGSASYDLSKEWFAVTGDSHQVDLKEIEGETREDLLKAFVEVFKYPLKLNDMSLEHQAEAGVKLKGKRLISAFGAFFGVVVPEDLNDEVEDLELLPYILIVYRYSEFSGYQISRHVDVKPGEVPYEPHHSTLEAEGLIIPTSALPY